MEIPSQLRALWQLAGGDPLDATSDWNSTFDPIGLILLAPPKNWGYWCTPENSVTFATTGGDGVHFGWAVLSDMPPDFAPVVMTVPMTDTPNLVVGENLREFLCLGCRFGYFGLEQLVYRPEETTARLAVGEFDDEASFEERSLLRKLSDFFDLKPLLDPGGRLRVLQQEYASRLQLPASADVV